MRGEANDARKVAMYLVKRLCDLTWPETAREFGVTSYGALGVGLFAGAGENGCGATIQEAGGLYKIKKRHINPYEQQDFLLFFIGGPTIRQI